MQTAMALDELSTLLTKIRGNSQSETDLAESFSRCIFGCSIDDLDLSQAKRLWHTVRIERLEQEQMANPTPGTCFQCGAPSSKGECIPCHEGMSVGEYRRNRANSF